MSDSRLEVSILIPVRNEGANLRIMVKFLEAMIDFPHEVLVVYDSEEDETIPVIEEISTRLTEVRGVMNKHGRGVINAIRAGVEAARGENVLIFAADEVGPILAIDDMLALMRQGCEFVSCTRYAYGGRRLGGSWVGGALSRLANFLFRNFAGCVMTDATTGIKMFRKDVFDRLELESRPVGWAVAFELSIKAQALGLKLGEVPIISIDRLYGGQSTFSLGSWVWEYGKWFLRGRALLAQSPHRMHRQDVMVRLPATSIEFRSGVPLL